jgi:hypothetical protein
MVRRRLKKLEKAACLSSFTEITGPRGSSFLGRGLVVVVKGRPFYGHLRRA